MAVKTSRGTITSVIPATHIAVISGMRLLSPPVLSMTETTINRPQERQVQRRRVRRNGGSGSRPAALYVPMSCSGVGGSGSRSGVGTRTTRSAPRPSHHQVRSVADIAKSACFPTTRGAPIESALNFGLGGSSGCSLSSSALDQSNRSTCVLIYYLPCMYYRI